MEQRQQQQLQQQQQQQISARMEQRTEQRFSRQITSTQQVQGMVMQSSPQLTFGNRPGDVSPPVFEQIFRNARFAQGGNALFEGKVRGNPKPVVSWTRKGAPLLESNKYKMKYDEQTGNVSLLINAIGPGDEGEYTCTARNQYGEAICSVYIQPEGQGQIIQQPPGGYQREFTQTVETSEQRTTQQRFQKQTTGKISYANGHIVEEDFKVDTFEYRLLREVEFRESITRRFVGEVDREISTVVDRSLGPVAPPQIAQKPRNSKLQEGTTATFQAKVPANPRPRITWFKNGQRITQSQKYESIYSNQQAVLKINSLQSEDSGHYTLLAENPQGCVVSSAYLAVESSATQDGLDQRGKVPYAEPSEGTETGKALAPNFVRVCNDRDVTEGKMTRFDCRVTGRPYPEVAWFINGQQVRDDATHKVLVNESGNHALMITNVSITDAGVITCVARNKAGETSFQCNLNVIEKEQVVAPKFVERFSTVHVKEGEPVVLKARAVGTPIPRISWQKDGVPLAPGPEVNIHIDGGASTLDIPRAKASDAAWYQCTAQNVAGSTATRARLFVETPKGATPPPRRLNLPRPTKVIEPEPEPGPEVIYLRHVERAKPHMPLPEEERIYPPPQFIIPLNNAHQVEGGRVHFEARIEPVGDPSMKVEWFVNGRPLAASSRATATFQFGFIALDLISIQLEDSGEYVCRVSSNSGSVESHGLLSVTGRVGIEQSSQHPDSLQYIQHLEDYSRYQRTESIEEVSSQRPNFIRPLQELGELQEGRNAHFEGQLTPVSDPTMRVEWFKDGKPITASSRITTIFNFGYVSLNILHLRAEDAGTYTVRAVNRSGEAISSSTLKVQARTSVTTDLGIPEQQRYIEKVEELEAYQQYLQSQRYVQEPPESTAPPEFKSPIKDQLNIREGGFAHFEARLEPIGDSTLRVEWLKDGKPVEASSRITSFFNFGYVALTIKSVTTHDIGTYSCRAINTLGEAVTSAKLTVVSKKDIIMDSQHPGGLEKIQYLEDTSRYGRSLQEETTVTKKPMFLGPLKGTNKIVEGQRAHFEARVEPQHDTTLQIEWYFNGKVIMTANRIQTYHDFGYVALDILSVRAEDAGTYTVVARNALGEAQLSASMVVETRSSIDTTSMHRGTYEKTQRLEDSKFVEPSYHIEEISKSKPIFVQPLSDPKPISEGKNIHLECRLEPMGDPTMRVEWFYNGRPITVGSRFRTYYDFGYVALDIVKATSMDSGEYTVRATNHLGSAHTSACVRVISRSDIVTETQNESALEQIQYLEDASRHRRTVTEDVTVVQAPQFTRPLHNIETVEGTNIHLECRLQPVGDPTMRVEWLINGQPVKTGHRFRPAYDFDYVALDLLSVYPVDSGVYTCVARNQLGEAVTSCSVKIIAKKDLILETQHPSGLEKIQYLEDTSRYRKTEYMDEVVNVRPRFITKPKNLDNMREGQHAHFECKLEPVTDPNLKVEWYKNGRPVTVGHRFRPIHDFGYVALDIIDLIAEDSGTYTCRAVNLLGSDETTCVLNCRSTAQILTGTQNETGLEQIQYLEDKSRYQRSEFIEETTKQAPIFTTSLKHMEIKEGQRAHFECRLIPVSDPTMKVEWFHNNVPVKSGSRFTETNNFGFVALDIMYCYPEDSGTYTCRAKNIVGEAMTSANLTCVSKKSIYMETQHEEALSKLTYLEDTSRHQRQTVQEETVTQAPMFTQPMKDVRVAENQAMHFEARLIPVGDPKLRVEWLRNGVPIQASNRVTTMHDFGYVALNMKYVYPEDSGTYTCRAINELGQAVTSATLVVHSKASLLLESQHEAALQKLQQLEDTSRYQRREEEEIIVTQPPKFTAQLNGPTELVEGHSAHYECRIEPYPDPNMRVEWFHNGKPLQLGHRFRTTYDFGFAALDILTVYPEDSGEYTCKATNKLGQASSSIKVNVKSRSSIIMETQHEGALQKIQYLEDDSRYKRTAVEEQVIAEKPQFGRPLRNIDRLPEGQSAHLEATLTPVNDPTMRVEWFCNGRPIPQGHRFKTTYDFGYVALDILYAYAEDSGTYMCKARNAVGEAVTTCSVTVEAKSGLQLDTLDETRLKKIKDLETYERPQKPEVEPEMQKPVFITPLVSLENLKEGEHAHLECRVEPINDPNLKIEWFVNGIAIKTGHRFRTTHDFGYVALDILYTYAEDSGTYMCKATNLVGEAVNTCQITVGARRSIYLESQHPEGLQKIQELEAQGRPARLEVEEPEVTPPRFVTELRGTTEIFEGQTAHFEAQVEPLHDPNLRIEFYHNGKPLPSASRFHITFDFGYLALDITHAVPEDAGEYTAKAINALGQCTSTITLRVTAKSNIVLESQRPEGLDKIRALEQHVPHQKPEVPEPTRQRPVFTQPLQNIDSIAEGQTAHFECRLIPVGDPTLKVEWFRNEKPLETSSRITKTHDFGYVALDMTHVRAEDDGVYMCRASNALGEAVTTASMKIKTKADIQLETQHPQGMKRIQQLEEGKAPLRPEQPEQEFDKPIFTQVLTGPSELWEGQHAHFECRVVPVGDPNMRYEWYINGTELKLGSRFHVTHDFGYVNLDINSVISEDSGVYMCKAINKAGEAVSSISLKVKTRSSIIGDTLQPDAWQKIQLKEAEMNKVPPQFVDTSPQQAPVFTTHLTSHDKLVEGQNILLEAQVEPRADPNLRVEWFKNGKPLATGTRLRTTFDFGHVTLSVTGLRADDSAIYTCKATNLLGEAVSTCTLKVEDRHWLLAGSLRPEALPKIEALEEPKTGRPEAPEPTYESPVFITHLNNVVCTEGDSVHFECHVEPSKDPTLNIEWFINGKPLPTGARYKSTYDFGYVALDIIHAYAEDSGVYSCKATNSKGQAATSGTLKCTSKQDIYLQTQHPQGEAGLEAVREVEGAYLSKYQQQPLAPEKDYPKPIFVVPLPEQVSLNENEALHVECQVEPKEDPNLKVEWFFNGKPLEHATRFKTTCDFGFVTLDLTDVYERDQGIYTCKATNLKGEAFTSTTIFCKGKESLIERTQHPKGAEGLEKIQDLEESLRRQEGAPPESEEGHPPVFTSQFQNLKNLSEGEIAHFEASLTPVGDQTMTVEWFYKGEVLKASHRIRTVHAFGMVVLEILGTKIEDSGTYTCRATNKWGRAEISVELECVDKSKGQKPHFTTHIQSLENLKEGESAHFECTLTPVGDPNLKVEWFHNGQPLRHSSRIKSVSDFGFVVMDISYVQSHDTGEYVCRASNKYGEDFTKATIKCTGRGGVYLDSLQPDALARIREMELSQGGQPQTPTTPVLEPPIFTTHISDVTNLVEGQSAHFEARLTPVNDPNLTVEWFYNGKKLPHGHRYRTFHDFGIVILDILYCYEENSGVYECRAVNKVGQDVTKATLKCVSKANLILDSQLPRGMEGGLEKIQSLEDSHLKMRDEKTTETKGQAPVFTVPLSNVDNLREGESAHFEARLIPTDDPKLKVEWFWNGKPLRTGSRFRTFCDFGFVILEISPVYPEDSGEYSCRAFNDYGEAVTTATMKVQGKRSIILESQLPKSMEHTIEKIAELEGLGSAPAPVAPEEDAGKPPEFVTTPSDLTLTENSLAHFECRLIPINDPSMRVEWFHNGKPLWAGSRIKTINDFGFVILEVAGVYQRDSGLYTCKATNKHGEATVSCQLQVRSRQGIILEPQLPTNFKTGTESIQKLEESLYKKDEIVSEEEKPNPPRFTVELKDIHDVQEGAPIHFECRVEPVGDPTMRIDWFHNGRPFATGSRVHMLNDFGFIVLDMDYTYGRDSGEYVCVATNKWGSATTKATLTCKAKRDIVLDSQLPQGISGEKLKELERGPVTEALPEEAPASPPKFITQITSVGIGEGEPVHFECRVEPRTDPKLRVEWYRNGKPLPSGHRFRTVYDMGFVSLDILYTYPEDSGEYVCRAVNDLGEDTTKATVSCKKLPTIILQNQVPKGMKKSEALMQMEATIKKYTSEIHLTEDDLYDPDKKQPPRFVTQIQDQTTLVEMQTTKFECQLAPVGDPNMKVEWFLNGKPLPHKNRFTPIYDFGYVAMNFGWVYPEDSGEYLCRATNLYGMDETRAVIRTAGKPGIIYESQLPKGMKSIERIREMEAAWQIAPEEAEEETKPRSAPVFVTKPEPYTTTEGEPARFCCRVTGHPRPRLMWVVNGQTVVNGTRYRLTYDGMWHLDIPKTRQYDHGKIEIIARNSAGEAIATTDLIVKPRMDDYRGVLKNSPRPWYDYDLTQYQRERIELERAQLQHVDISEHQKKVSTETETEWQQTVKKKKGEDYYSKLKELEEEQVIKETRLREASHQFAIPGEKVVAKTVAKGMAQSYEQKLDEKEEEKPAWVTSRRPTKHVSETVVDSKTIPSLPPEPSESAIHAREVHVAKQKQTQKEVKGDVEITRKITATETTEVEHKAKTQERVVQGPVKPAKPPFFTKKIQPVRVFEQEQARFEVEFDGDPLPTIKWFREDFPIQSSADLQIHTFSTKSVLILRQVFMEDSGVFRVVAENRGGVAKCSANLVVEEKRRQGRGGVVPPSFLTTIESNVVNSGTLVRFDARIAGTRPIDVYWLKNGKRIPSSDIRYKTLEEDNVNTLLIIEAVPEDSGTYECVAINSAGEARCEAECQVRSPAQQKQQQQQQQQQPAGNVAPAIIEPLKGQVVKEGQPVTFQCRISGKPAPQIKWQKGDSVIKPSKYFQMHKDNDIYTLRISEAFPEDEGTYKCIATNPVGSVTLSAQLKVLAPDSQEVMPTITPLKDVTVPEGSSAQFRTKVTGKPMPTIQWFREGVLIPQSADFQMIQDGDNRVLLITTTYEEDSGTFTCRATNSAGQVESSAKLIVKKKPEVGRAPHFIEQLKPLSAIPGHPAELKCVVVGEPTPEVVWLRDGQKVFSKPGQEVSYNPESGTACLTISEPTQFDEAVYSVQAINKFGRAVCRANLVLGEAVEVKQPQIMRAPHITRPLQAIAAFKDEPVELVAAFEGEPIPEVKWFRNGKEVVPSKGISIVKQPKHTILRIEKINKSTTGMFEVRAINPVGEAKTSCSVTVTEQQPEMTEARPPSFIKALQPKIVTAGEVVILETVVESYPTCSFQWFHLSTPVKSTTETRIVTEANKSLLVLQDVNEQQTGSYTCRAENVVGSVTCTATVSVIPDEKWEDTIELEAPHFEQKLVPLRVMDGEPVQLTCKVVGKPIPKVIWHHKGQPIKETKGVTMYQDSEGVCKLAITEVFPEDAGEYTCHAINKAGEAICATSLVVEAYEYVPDSEIATTGVSLATGQSGSEEDLLVEKETISEVSEMTELHPGEVGKAPRFVTYLPETVTSRDGELIRLEVKAEGIPKPKIRWYKQGTELTPSKDFDVEDFEDGTSVLTIAEIFPDDAGEILCEAQNDFGIDTTVTELVVEGILGTKEYRKPEWVTQMEQLKEKLMATQSAPTFVQEIRDNRVKEMETVTFECQFSGNPLPDITWYKDGKALRNTRNIQIRIRNNKTTCQILKVTPEDRGTYTCKAITEVGIAETKGELFVQELSLEEREKLEVKKGKEKHEKIKLERVKTQKKPKPEEALVDTVIETDSKRKIVDIHETHVLESTTQFAEKTEKVTAQKVFPVQDSVEISAIASCKKVDDTTEKPILTEEKAKEIVPVQESITVSEVEVKDDVKFLTTQETQVTADTKVNIQESVSISTMKSEDTVKEFEVKHIEEQASRKVSVQESVSVSEVIAEDRVVDFKETKPKEEGAVLMKPIQESFLVTETLSETTITEIKDTKTVESAEYNVPILEPMVVSEIQTEATVEEVEDKKPKSYQAKPDESPVQQEVAEITDVKVERAPELVKKEEQVLIEKKKEETEEIVTEKKKTDIVAKKKTTVKKKDVELEEEVIVQRALKTMQKLERWERVKQAQEVEELLHLVPVQEFGPESEKPLRELARVGWLLRRGLNVQEVTALHRAGHFHELRTPLAQSALVSLVERKGHGILVSQALAEEDEVQGPETAGFRAFLRMIELESATVEQAVTLFAPEDFRPDSWEVQEATEVVEKTHITQQAQIIQQAEVRIGDEKKVTKKKKTKTEVEKEEDFTLSIVKEKEVFQEGVEEILVTELQEGDVLYSVSAYEAENEDAMNLVEGEKVYIIDNNNPDWWFVKKHLTEEKGWVPAQLLMDEITYTTFVQKVIQQKIDQLPVFEKPTDKATAPRFVEKLQPKHAPDGTTVEFQCQISGSPRPQVTWFKQTAILLPSHDFQMYYNEDNVATLVIREAFPEDAGTYTCVAKNTAGFASSSTELIVEGPLSDHGSDVAVISRKSVSRESSLADILEGIPPMFTQKPVPLSVDEGSDVKLDCQLVAVPEPVITWYFNKKEIDKTENVSVTVDSDVHMYFSKVTIKKVKKSQEGVYEVIARNSEGETSMPIMLKVKTAKKEPPSILEPLKPTVVHTGDPVVLRAVITGNPAPKVTWLKDGLPADDLPVSHDGDLHSIFLKDVGEGDSGLYTVKAENPVGSVESTSSLVVEAPDENMEPPLFTERFEEVKVPEKGKLLLVAKVTGKPVPEITWLRNNRPLKPSSNLTLSFDGTTSTLEIPNVDSEVDAGNYKCIAKNPAGITSHGARVSVDVPEVTFVRKLQEITEVEEREALVLECETSHTVSTHWFHEGHELSGMDHRVVVQEGRIHRLQIKNCTSRDAGLYQCRVRDQVTEGHVTVHDKKPEFVRKLQDFEVKERESAILEVEITSETAEVTWHKDGEQLTDTSDKFVFEKQGTVRKLLIRGVSVHDEGEYTCALGEQECTAEVSVVELPPEITTKMQDVTVAKGEKATFEIELTKGDALVRWFKDDKELQFSEHVQLSIDGKRQRLKVYNSELKDAGVYSCEVGEQTSSARLTVEEPAVQFLKKLPDVTLIPLNMDATFTVELSRPDVDVKWLMKGKEIKASERYQITSEGSVKKLIVKNVTIEDQTDYSCVALNVKSTSKLKVEIIETPPKINIESLKKEYRVKKGDDVTIEVKFTAAPPPKDEWFINGKLVKKSPRITQTLAENSATVTIKQAEETDAASYTLKLSNTRGEASAEMTLVLMEPPSEPGIPEVVEVTEESITLHWKPPEFDGHSPITNYILEYHDKTDFTWIQVKEVVKETTHKVSQLQTDVEYMFRVSAENDVGRGPPSHNTQYIRVAKPVSAEPPTIQKPLEGVVCGLHQSISLSCVIGGIPEPTVKWMKDGKVFKSKNLTYENRIAKCTISETTETSSGIYTCQATNTAGFAETSCELKIQEPPKLEFDESLTTQKLRITNQWKIEVKYSGFPKPEVVWTKNGKSLASTKHCSIYYDEYSSTIAIYSLAKVDTGTYTFTARSEAGTASVDFSLKVIDKPSKPEGPIIVKDIRKDSVVLEWKPPADDGGLELSKYSVEKCDVEKMVWMKVADVEKDVSSYCVQRLREDSEYMFRIIAENPVGTSEPLESDPVTIRSKLDKPSAPRGPLDISGMTETSFTAAWQPPESDGGAPVLEYVIERREVGKKAWQKVGSTAKDVTHIEVSGLKTNTSHHVRITARNEVGLSAPYAPDDVITVGMRIRKKVEPKYATNALLVMLGAFRASGVAGYCAPSAPTNLQITDITSKSVTLQWGPPASTGGTELTGYIIEKRELSSKKWSKAVTLEPTVFQYCIENLKDRQEYFFRVYAENAIGLSPPAGTDLVYLKKHATVPSPPTAPLEIRPIGPNAVVIAWGIPETDGGAPLQGYTIAIRDVRKTMWMEVGRVKADVHKLTIKDLQENHEYLIRIFAKNEVGPSEPLESEEPFKMLRPTEVDQLELDKLETTAPTLSFSTETTTSWMKEAGMDADIRSYARGSLLRRDEYFFRIWYYARQLFK